MRLPKWKRVWSEFGAYSKLKKICVHNVFLKENMRAQGLFKLKKTFCTHIFLSLENAPNSGVEFGVCSKLEVEFGVAPN